MKKKTAHIISHTHWDREWRAPIWRSRYLLEKMMDELLETFRNNPEYTSFLLDGQVIAVEDYLEFYPERTDEIKQLIKAGKLVIGPWYNLPDEYPLNGECLVHNLLWGSKKAESFGKCLKIGYTTFGWGQTAQLPQIYAGFGINFIIASKNISRDRAPNSEFIWRSPDGTETITSRLGSFKRNNFYFGFLLPVLYGKHYDSHDWGLQWPGRGWYRSDADPKSDLKEALYLPDFKLYEELIKEQMKTLINTAADSLVKHDIFIGDGCDYTGSTPFLHDIIKRLNQLSDEYEFIHSNLDTYVDAVKTQIDRGTLKTVHGEMRDGPVAACSGNALATRMNLKSLNRKAQHGLINIAEPISSLGMLLGIDYPRAYLDKAWEYLLRSHSHDAVNGVTYDKTSLDIEHRLRQTVELSNTAAERTLTEMLRKIDLKGFDKDDILLAVFNPLPSRSSQIVSAFVNIPKEMNVKYLTVKDKGGQSYTVQHICREDEIVQPAAVRNSRAIPFECDRHKIYFDTGSLPPFGFKVFRVEPVKTFNRKARFWPEDLDFGSQLTAPQTMENEFVRVKINFDGTFDLTNKQTGNSFTKLNYFEDSGDSGNYWQREIPAYNREIITLGRPAQISLIEDGPLVTSFLAEIDLEVPACYDKNTQSRSKEKTVIKISSTITLKANRRWVEIETHVTNTAKDHRLRVHFPSGLQTDFSNAEGHFLVDTRTISQEVNEHGGKEAFMKVLPQQHFVNLKDDRAALTILNRNITEFEVLDNDSRNIALTLLRCVPVKICAEFRCPAQAPDQSGSQCLGEHTFSYAVFAHQPGLSFADIYNAKNQYLSNPPRYQISNHGKGELTNLSGLFEILNPEIQLSCLKKAENDEALIIRLFNPSDEEKTGNIRFFSKPQSAQLTNMNEEVESELTIDNNGNISFSFPAYKILTLKVFFKL